MRKLEREIDLDPEEEEKRIYKYLAADRIKMIDK